MIQGNAKSALKLLTKAVLGNYREPRMFFDRAKLLTELGRHNDAVKDLTRAMARRKDCPAAALLQRQVILEPEAL